MFHFEEHIPLSYEPGMFTVNGESASDSYFSGGLLDYDHPDALSYNETLRLAFDVRVSDIASAGQIIENVAQITAYTDLSDPSGSVVDQVKTNYIRIEVVPEPSTLIFLGIGMPGLLAFVRKKRTEIKISNTSFIEVWMRNAYCWDGAAWGSKFNSGSS